MQYPVSHSFLWEAIETSQLMNRLHKHKHLEFFLFQYFHI